MGSLGPRFLLEMEVGVGGLALWVLSFPCEPALPSESSPLTHSFIPLPWSASVTLEVASS